VSVRQGPGSTTANWQGQGHFLQLVNGYRAEHANKPHGQRLVSSYLAA
jgi:hypothetical protein